MEVFFIFVFILVSLLIASILLDLICIVMLVVWVCKLWKRKLFKRKTKFVFSYILFLLVVFLIGNTVFVFSGFDSGLVIIFAIRTVVPLSFGVYILISLKNIQKNNTATNRHTNPPSTRVSLPTDIVEHVPNFISPSTAEPSEVPLL